MNAIHYQSFIFTARFVFLFHIMTRLVLQDVDVGVVELREKKLCYLLTLIYLYIVFFASLNYLLYDISIHTILVSPFTVCKYVKQPYPSTLSYLDSYFVW